MAIKSVKVDLANVDRDRLQKVLEERRFGLIDINNVSPNPDNKNKMGQNYFNALLANMANPNIGFTVPVLLRPNPEVAQLWETLPPEKVKWTIIDGEHRWKAAKQLGMTQIPAILFPDIPRSLALYLMVESNKIHGQTADEDVKSILSAAMAEADAWLKENNTDIFAMTVTETSGKSSGETSYEVGEDVNQEADEQEMAMPTSLYFTKDQKALYNKIVGQYRLANAVTAEVSVYEIIKYFADSTGFGEIPKEGQQVVQDDFSSAAPSYDTPTQAPEESPQVSEPPAEESSAETIPKKTRKRK